MCFKFLLKVKIFTDQGQAILTETGDFELNFHDGSKYLRTKAKVSFKLLRAFLVSN